MAEINAVVGKVTPDRMIRGKLWWVICAAIQICNTRGM
jgi:hypothetical protein